MEDYNTINSFPRPNLPDGFRTVIYSLSKEVLREQPMDLYEFCAEYFGKRLLSRGDSWVSFKERYTKRKAEETVSLLPMPEPVIEETTDLPPTPPVAESFTKEEEEAAVKIQAGVRGMLARNSLRDTSSPTDERERWAHPQQQMERDLATCSSSITFAQLEAESGDWEECQRWLHPDQQLQRDLVTGSESVEFADIRDRTASVLDVTWWEDYQRWNHPSQQLRRDIETSGEPVDSADDRDRTFSATDIVLPPPIEPPTVPPPSSPPKAVSTAHSDISVADSTPPADAALERPPSVASVQSAKHSELDLGDGTPADGVSRAASLEAVSQERVAPAGAPSSPPPPPPDITTEAGQRTASSQLDLASEQPTGEPAQRAGSPAEAASPAHSDVDVAGAGEQPTAEAGRAGSPPEAVTPVGSSEAVAAPAAAQPAGDQPAGEQPAGEQPDN